MSSNIPTGTAYETLVKKFEAEKGITRVPTVCVAPTDGLPSESDRKKMGDYLELREIYRELDNKHLKGKAREDKKAKAMELVKKWKGDVLFVSLAAPKKFVNPMHETRVSEVDKMAVTIALEAIEKAEATLTAAGKEINNPARLTMLQQQGSIHPDGKGWSYDRLRRFLIKHRPANTETPETPSRPAHAGTKGPQPAL